MRDVVAHHGAYGLMNDPLCIRMTAAGLANMLGC
jgi:hypothetical protein